MLRLESEVAREIEREIAISRPSSAQIGASAERGSEAEGATSAALVPAHLEASYRRHAKYRALYGDVATELARQMRVESKTRASIFEAIVLKAWALCDELLPELRRAAGLRSAAVAEARALRAELATAEAQRLRSEQHAEQVEP